MKRIFNILCTTVALLTLLAGCQKPEEETKIVDLRYRALDNYELPATDAQVFTILVCSSEEWTISSEHSDWCIISQEEGEGAPIDSVRIGHAPITTVRVKYYDNTFLTGLARSSTYTRRA